MALKIAELKAAAQYKCEGCRLSWRLKGWQHGEPMPMECRAKAERQAIRDLSQQITPHE